MNTFIKDMQEEARDFAHDSTRYEEEKTTVWHLNDAELYALVYQVIHATAKEIEKRVEGTALYVVDKRFNPDDSPELIEAISLDAILSIIHEVTDTSNINYTQDDIVNLPTKKIVIERGDMLYVARYFLKNGREVFFEYQSDMQEELKTKFPNCIFLVNP